MGRARKFPGEFQRETIALADRVFPEGGDGDHRRIRGKLDVRIGDRKPPDKLRLTEMSNIFDLGSASAVKVRLFNLQAAPTPTIRAREKERGKRARERDCATQS